jgi:hypothetical protein
MGSTEEMEELVKKMDLSIRVRDDPLEKEEKTETKRFVMLEEKS